MSLKKASELEQVLRASGLSDTQIDVVLHDAICKAKTHEDDIEFVESMPINTADLEQAAAALGDVMKGGGVDIEDLDISDLAIDVAKGVVALTTREQSGYARALSTLVTRQSAVMKGLVEDSNAARKAMRRMEAKLDAIQKAGRGGTADGFGDFQWPNASQVEVVPHSLTGAADPTAVQKGHIDVEALADFIQADLFKAHRTETSEDADDVEQMAARNRKISLKEAQAALSAAGPEDVIRIAQTVGFPAAA